MFFNYLNNARMVLKSVAWQQIWRLPPNSIFNSTKIVLRNSCIACLFFCIQCAQSMTMNIDIKHWLWNLTNFKILLEFIIKKFLDMHINMSVETGSVCKSCNTVFLTKYQVELLCFHRTDFYFQITYTFSNIPLLNSHSVIN